MLKSSLQAQQTCRVSGLDHQAPSLHWRRSLTLAGDVETPEEKTDSTLGVLGPASSLGRGGSGLQALPASALLAGAAVRCRCS